MRNGTCDDSLTDWTVEDKSCRVYIHLNQKPCIYLLFNAAVMNSVRIFEI